MALEDFYDAVSFRAWGIPDPRKWVDELREQAMMESFNALM
jgi:hypothetical protein